MKRPNVPSWHHDLNEWVFEGKTISDSRIADYHYTVRLMEYCDFIEDENDRLREELEDVVKELDPKTI